MYARENDDNYGRPLMHKLLRYAKNVLRYAAIITLCVVITLYGVTDVHDNSCLNEIVLVAMPSCTTCPAAVVAATDVALFFLGFSFRLPTIGLRHSL